MAMELKQQLKLSQQLVMTPQLQQAIKLLQLSRMELLEQVREEIEQNPLLEQPDEVEDTLAEKSIGEASLEAATAEAAPETEARVPETAAEIKVDGDGPPEIDWEAYLNSYQFTDQTTTSNRGSQMGDEFPSFETNLVRKETLASL